MGVVLKMVRFFEDDGLGIGPIEGFNGDRFRELFLSAYKLANPSMEQFMDTKSLLMFETYHEFYHTAIAADILYIHERDPEAKKFEAAIISFCQLAVDRVSKKFLTQ